MGGAKYNMNSSQFDMGKNDIEYSRKGGCFVTTPRAIIYLILTIAASIFVGVIVYYYGPNSAVPKMSNRPPDIEKLLNDSIESVPKQNIRLPKNLRPFYYKLRLDPIKNDSSDNFTLMGEVEIFFECLEKTKTVVLNAEDLRILTVEAAMVTLKETSKRKRRHSDDGLQDFNSGERTVSTTASTNMQTNISTTMLSTIPISTPTTTATTIATTDATSIPTTIQTNLPTQSAEKTANPAAISEVTEEDVEGTTLSTSAVMTVDNTTANHVEEYRPKAQESVDVKIKDHKTDGLNLKYVIQLQKELVKRKNYTLKISFSAEIAESFEGLYRTSYAQGSNKTWLLATKFQPIYARNLFPCFDEPSFKVPVEMTIGKTNNQTILSNGALTTTYTNVSTGVTWDHFKPTNPISTYQFGFVIADLNLLSIIDGQPKIQIWASKISEIKVDYVVGVIVKMVEYFEEYFGTKYLGEQLDIVAVRGLPSVSTQSAGLILVKESLFLDAADSNREGKKLLFSVLGRNLVSEWMENLVSIEWWDDFWVVKGMSIFLQEELARNLGKWDYEFSLKVTIPTLHSDDYKSARNLHFHVENNLQIYEILNEGHHKKGSCLLRMLNNSLAPNTFEKGVQLYIRTWKDQSASVAELWRSIDIAVSEIDQLPQNTSIGKIMDTWTVQSGYPLITVTRKDDGIIMVNQTKFQIANEAQKLTDHSLWVVPLTYMIGGDDNSNIQSLWLTEKSTVISNITDNYNDTWILFNVDQKGYYRVNYGVPNWQSLIKALKNDHTKIPIANRGQLIDDAFELAEHGLLDYQIPFELSQYLAKERNYIPWSAVLSSFEFIRGVLKSTYVNGAYEDYVTQLVGSLYDSLGPEDKADDSTNDIQLRKLIVDTACSVNYVNCTKWALQKMQEFMDNGQEISLSNRKTVLCTGVKLGSRKEWNSLFERLHTVESSTNVKDLYSALGCTKHQWLINRYLHATLNGTIEWQYVPYVWQSLKNVPGLSFGFKFLRENWLKIYSIYKEKRFILKSIIHDFLSSLSTKTDLEDLSLFFQMHEADLQDFSPLFQGVVDRIKARLEWTEQYLSTIDLWLSINNYK